MNPQSKWPLVCAGTVAGCLVGYVVGGGLSSSGGKSAGHRDSGGPEIVTPAARAIQPQALAGTADDGAKHGETALLSALREPNELRRAHDLFGVIDKMAPGDVAAAIALARRMPEQRWAGADPQAASAAVLALPPGDLRNRVLESVVESLGSRDVPAALRLIEQMPPGNARKDALGQISQRWASSDPQAAAQYVSALPPGDTQKRAVSSVAAVWARTDAGAALAWTAQLPEGVAVEAKAAVVRQWAEKDPRAAAEYLIKTDPAAGEDNFNMLDSIANTWARTDPSAPLTWAGQIGDEKLRAKVLGGVIESMASEDPLQAARLLTQLPAAKQSEAAGKVADVWAQSDPAAAAAWVMQLPEGEARKYAVRHVAGRWAEEDLVTNASWLKTLPAGPSRDAAVSAFTFRATGTDPESAAAWASTIADAGRRNEDLGQIAQQWLRSDKAAATRWITRNPALDAATKQRLLRGN